jgi:hypothetical protein
MKKCKDQYGVCLWFGPEEDCERLNGHPICPECGSDVVDMVMIPRMERIERRCTYPRVGE